MALPEIFPQGDIQVNVGAQELTPADISVQPTPEGARLTDAASGLEIGLNLTPNSSNECAVGDGGFGFDFSPLFRARYSFKWITQYRLGFIPVGIKPNVTFLATLGGDASLWLQKLEVTCGFDVKIGKVLVPIPDTPIYVVFDFSGGLDLSAAIDPRVEAEAHTEVTIGIKNNSLYRDASATVQLPSLNDLLGSGNLNAYAMVNVWLKASAKIQGIVGPRIQVGPFAEATLTDDPARPWFALDMGLAGQVALDIDLGSFGTLTPVSWTGEIPIASGLGACALPFGPGFSGPPCRIAAPRMRPDGSTRSFQPRIASSASGAPLFRQAGRYAVIGGDYTWSEAEATARLSEPPRCASAHLATITSREEQDALSSAFGSSLVGKWLGARQDGSLEDPSADWHWVTGEPWTYTNWQAGEPNDDQGVNGERPRVRRIDGPARNLERLRRQHPLGIRRRGRGLQGPLTRSATSPGARSRPGGVASLARWAATTACRSRATGSRPRSVAGRTRSSTWRRSSRRGAPWRSRCCASARRASASGSSARGRRRPPARTRTSSRRSRPAQAGDRAWLSMRHIDGPTLDGLLRAPGGSRCGARSTCSARWPRRSTPWRRAGRVHGAVRPDNVLVGPGDHAYLTDFGVAAALRPGPVRAGGPAADRRGLADTAYEALTGAPPSRGGPPASARNPALGPGGGRRADPARALGRRARRVLAAAVAATPGAASSRAVARVIPAAPASPGRAAPRRRRAAAARPGRRARPPCRRRSPGRAGACRPSCSACWPRWRS